MSHEDHGTAFVRKVIAVFGALCCLLLFGAVDLGARLYAQDHYERLGLHGNPSFEIALAGGPTVGTGSQFSPSTTYNSLADTGGGINVNAAGGIQLANPVAEDINFSNAAPLSFTNASGTTTVASSTTGTLDVTTVAGNGIDGMTIEAPSGTTPRSTLALGGNSTTIPAVFCKGTLPCDVLTTPAASTDVFQLDAGTAGTPGTCTGVNSILKISKAGAFNAKFLCNGTFQNLGLIEATGNGNLVEFTPTLAGPTNILTEALPVYAVSAGGVLSIIGNTIHAIVGACAFSASTTCTSSTQSGGAAWGVAFTGAGTVTCSASPSATSGVITVSAVTTTSITLTAASSNSSSVQYICIGT